MHLNLQYWVPLGERILPTGSGVKKGNCPNLHSSKRAPRIRRHSNFSSLGWAGGGPLLENVLHLGGSDQKKNALSRSGKESRSIRKR